MGARGRRACLAIAAVGVGWLTTTPGAVAGVTCSYDPASRVVTAEARPNGGANRVDGIYREGDRIMADTNRPCGAATVRNTDRIVITDASGSGSLGNFPPPLGTNLEPGFTDEPGTSDEIEIVLNYGPRDDGVILFPATPSPGLTVSGPAKIAAGTTGGTSFLNLNAGEATGIDADVTMRGVDYLTIFLGAADGGRASDEIRADGDAGTGGVFDERLSAIMGPGNDLVVGGAESDFVLGQSGRDVVVGGAGFEELIGGAGNDRLFGGSFIDSLIGGTGNDLLNGGQARDRCRGGGGANRFVSCEDRG